MKLNNRIYNWIHGVKRVRTKGAINCGKRKLHGEWVIVRYDWTKPVTYQTKKIDISSFMHGTNKKIIE